MARIRSIKPKFWDDLKLSKISRDARLTFIAFWNFADDNGIIIAENTWLRAKIYPHEVINSKKFSSWVQEMLEVDLIIPVVFRKSHFYLLPNFQKHQIINRPNYEDVFIPTKSLDELYKNSVSNQGLLTDGSVPYRKGEERRGKEGIGGVPPSKKEVATGCLFKDSEFFNKEIFMKKFEGTDYATFNLGYYHEAVNNWSESKQETRKDWLAVARTFMLGDMKKGIAAMQNVDLLKKNTNGNSANKTHNNTGYSDLEARLDGSFKKS